jgi:hypothetical protein
VKRFQIPLLIYLKDGECFSKTVITCLREEIERVIILLHRLAIHSQALGMRVLNWLLLSGSCLALGQYSQDDVDSGQVLLDLGAEAYGNALGRLGNTSNTTEGCTPQNVRVRREWYVIIPS